jgi:hypothetical protein
MLPAVHIVRTRLAAVCCMQSCTGRRTCLQGLSHLRTITQDAGEAAGDRAAAGPQVGPRPGNETRMLGERGLRGTQAHSDSIYASHTQHSRVLE